MPDSFELENAFDRTVVIGILANEIIGYHWNIEDDIELLRNPRTFGEVTEQCRKSIGDDKEKIRALKRLSQKLNLWDEVKKLVDEEA